MIELLLQAERAMSVGLVDRAEVLYRQVAEADPKNSIAVVGLARVALERGDETGALTLAQRALTIDPENAAAARMVDRLDEILRYRGDEPAAAAESVAAPADAAEPVAAPADVPGPADVPAPAPTGVPGPADVPGQTATATPKRRSLLDRLLRRNR